MKRIRNTVLLSTAMILIVMACKNDDPTPAQIATAKTEVITTMKLYFTDRASDTSRVKIFSFKDPDGPGAMPYTTLDTILLDHGKIYDTQVILLNEMTNPVDSTSKEIYQESAQHQFFYEVSGDALNKLSVTYKVSDVDSNHVPLGMYPVFTTTAATTLKTGTVKIMLMHQPGVKPLSGQGDSTKGKVDIQVRFPLLIQ